VISLNLVLAGLRLPCTAPETTIFFANRDLCINRNNHQKPTFHPLGDFLNPALALLGQGLKKSPIGKKLDFANHPYLCKGLYILIILSASYQLPLKMKLRK
jgi:hypothetical protein